MPETAFFITSQGWGGLEMNTLKLARLLQARGVEIMVVTTAGSPFYQYCQEYFDNIQTIPRPKKYFDCKSAWVLGQMLKHRQVRNVVITDNRDIDVLALARRFVYRNLRLIYQQHMQLGGNKKGLIHTFRYKALEYWVTPLHWLKQQILEKTRFPEERIRVVPLGIDTSRFDNNALSRQQAREQLELPQQCRLLGVIGRIDAKKGQLFLVKALAHLHQQYPDMALLIFGSPTVNDDSSQEYYEQIRRYISAYQLEHAVYMRSSAPETTAFYQAIDIFALPSESETYGMVTIEAMLMQRPVIASNRGGTPEILAQGHYGQLYDYDDIESFCSRVNWIITHADDVNNRCRQACTYAREHFDVQVEVQGIYELLASC